MADPSGSWGNLKNVFGLNDTQVQSLQNAGFTADQATQLMNLSSGGGGTRLAGTGGSSTTSVDVLPTIGGSGLTPSMLASLATLLGRGGGNQPTSNQPTGNVSGVGAPDQPNQQVARGQAVQGGNQPITGGQGGNQPVTGGGQQLSSNQFISGGGSGGTQQVTGGAVDPNQVMINLGARALNERAVYPPTPGPADPTSGVSSGIGTTGATGATPTTITAGVPTARDVGLKGQNLGPWATTPGIFTRAPTLQPTTPTGVSPFTPTPQATGTQVARPQPWATAPAAPGVTPPGGQTGFDAAHNLALAHAGMSLYAHYGGNPFSASPADIAGFHGELQEALKGGKPIKMRSGGYVSGQPGPDRVPAMLTSGEYVLNKDAVQKIGVGNLNSMNRQGFQSGGSVTDDDDDQPPEARRKIIKTSGGQQRSSSTTDQESTSTSSSTSSSTPPAAPGGTGSQIDWAKIAEARQAQANAPNIGSLAGEQAYVTGEPVSGIQTGPSASQVSGAIGGLASGITAAAQAYANSIKPWVWQKSAIPNPPSTSAYEPPQLSQVNVPQSKSQQQTISPFAPYYPYE
jgi:hypothetical protein